MDIKLLHSRFYYDNGVLRYKHDHRKRKKDEIAGCIMSIGYRIIHFDGKKRYEHRLIWEMFNGTPPDGYDIDHINGVRSDNRIENLRLATRQQNLWNSRSKGYYLNKGINKYVVKINVNYKQLTFGSYADEELAALIAEEAKNKYYGNFVRNC